MGRSEGGYMYYNLLYKLCLKTYRHYISVLLVLFSCTLINATHAQNFPDTP